ncbi:16S rRNA (guanine(966)-N(2))-methyltransferase RsmD [Luteolibacter sp. AS25]|uniref:16S rRNA (guanine(966)-N(2))-methyltransferase RsmD n=1 Tax=Luteolibacter sp. AS25 TaxID=3135776 RepID=UPI00398B9DD8
MRIIAGKAGRIAIKVPRAVARPTTDYVRQAIFSMLGDTVFDARVLDLFCGSGAIGLEALSRGASSCVFVDEHRNSTSTVQENLEKARLEGGRVVKSDSLQFLKRDPATYDLIFADPPYWKHYGDTDHVKNLLALPALPERLEKGGHFVAEISTAQSTPESPVLQLLDRREYGSSTILVFKHP